MTVFTYSLDEEVLMTLSETLHADDGFSEDVRTAFVEFAILSMMVKLLDLI